MLQIVDNFFLLPHLISAKSVGMLCNMKDTIDVALEVSVIFSCHGPFLVSVFGEQSVADALA